MKINKDKTVLCIGSFFTRNYGDRAIFSVIQQALYSQAGIKARPFPLKPLFANRYGASMGLIKKIIIGALLLPRHYILLFKRARASSAITIGGGNLIHDVYPLTVIQFLFTCFTIKAARRKFLIFAIGAGPLRSRFSRMCISIAGRMSEGIIVRDNYSKSVLRKCWGLENHLRSEIVPDVVLSIDSEKKRSIKNAPLQVGISAMFYMMPGKYPGGNIEQYEAYLDKMETLLRMVIDRLEAKVVIFSTEPSEDQETVNDLKQRVADLQSVSITRVHSLPNAIRLTGSCDFHIGARLHSLILSLAQSVPSIALTSHGRVTGLFTELEAKDLIYDISDFDPASVIDSLELLKAERGRLLIKNVNKLKRQASKGISNMVEEINALVAESHH